MSGRSFPSSITSWVSHCSSSISGSAGHCTSGVKLDFVLLEVAKPYGTEGLVTLPRIYLLHLYRFAVSWIIICVRNGTPKSENHFRRREFSSDGDEESDEDGSQYISLIGTYTKTVRCSHTYPGVKLQKQTRPRCWRDVAIMDVDSKPTFVLKTSWMFHKDKLPETMATITDLTCQSYSTCFEADTKTDGDPKANNLFNRKRYLPDQSHSRYDDATNGHSFVHFCSERNCYTMERDHFGDRIRYCYECRFVKPDRIHCSSCGFCVLKSATITILD
ncbi:unnamed protein product, partial [Mesorhabditis belari]|uniref:Uncharacterized protein n=1 Tax=Mesorhabditis belari TaxID=2138241 RepID=A0AAF3ELP9_9BILA